MTAHPLLETRNNLNFVKTNPAFPVTWKLDAQNFSKFLWVSNSCLANLSGPSLRRSFVFFRGRSAHTSGNAGTRASGTVACNWIVAGQPKATRAPHSYNTLRTLTLGQGRTSSAFMNLGDPQWRKRDQAVDMLHRCGRMAAQGTRSD